MSLTQRASVYQRITADIIAAIERGAGAYRMPWHHDGAATHRPMNVASDKPYRGINTLALWASAEAQGFSQGLWGTYRQWTTLGAQVRKGERATLGVVWKNRSSTEDDQGTVPNKPAWFARGFSLFNLAQVDGYAPPAMSVLDSAERLAQADAFVANLHIHIDVGGDMAYYHPPTDTVHLPPFERFVDAQAHASVTMHECAHASGAPHRLDRDLAGRFGSQAYAMEECIADLTASYILADLGIAHSPRPDHAAYIHSWLEVLTDDPRAIFTAASKAQQAADWMHDQQNEARPAEHLVTEA